MLRCAAGLALIFIVIAGRIAPTFVRGQERSPLAKLEAFGLETAKVGRVTAYFAPEDRQRAVELATLTEKAATLHERELGLSFDLRLGALGSRHWFSEFPDMSYTIPWCDITGRAIFVPASDVKLPENGFTRAIDFIALHEYGHIASKRYFHPASTREYGPVQWFEEFLATYFGYAYVRTAAPAWADALRREWRVNVERFTPRERSLDWRFMRQLPPEELGQTYAWYQQVLNLRVADVYDRHGLGFLRAARTRLPWATLDDWTTATLVPALEAVAPGFRSWSEGFERSR